MKLVKIKVNNVVILSVLSIFILFLLQGCGKSDVDGTYIGNEDRETLITVTINGDNLTAKFEYPDVSWTGVKIKSKKVKGTIDKKTNEVIWDSGDIDGFIAGEISSIEFDKDSIDLDSTVLYKTGTADAKEIVESIKEEWNDN